MICDTHIHSKEFSADADMTIQQIMNFLSNNTDAIVCTTEHFDYDYTLHLPFNELKVDLDEYALKFNLYKQKFENEFQKSFPVLFGIEFGYFKHLGKFYNYISQLRNFDCIINSVHCIDNRDPYWERDIFERGKKEIYSLYLETIIEMLSDSDCFDVVGHFDYISRYSPYDDKLMRYMDFPDHFDKIFNLCISKGKALELNTKTCAAFKRDNPEIFYDVDIIKRYKELGGELITYGSDAHEISKLFNLYEETREMLLKYNFKYFTYYKNRKPLFEKI